MNVEHIIQTEVKIPLKSRTIIHLLLVTNKINESFTQVLKPLDVSLQQFNVLRILRGQKGKPANLSTLNARMVTKMSNTTRLVDKLILKDLVERFTCEKNRRKVDIFITEKGLNLLKELDPVIDATETNITKNLNSDELETLNYLLTKIRD